MVFNIDFRQLKLKNGKTIQQQLKEEARRFKDILQKHIDDFYNAYTPVLYNRTYNMRNSIYVDDAVDVEISNGNLRIIVKYSNDVFHSSLFGEEQINTLYLMDSGYKVNKGWHKDIPYFGFRSGSGFLQKAVDEFNRDNYFGIKAEVVYPDSFTNN